MRALWLADVLRDAGCAVVEQPGWKTRGNEFSDIKGVVDHHTGPGSSRALIDLVTNGRTDLKGPLSQLFLDEDGTFHVIASGKSNHAGPGRWQGVTSGNSNLIGIEAKNNGDGKDIWEAAQMDAYVNGVAAILTKIKADAVMVCGHKEWALPHGRKVDPSFDMVAFRNRVDAKMKGVAHEVATPATVNPTYAMLKKGDSNNSVRKLQKLLADLHFYAGELDGDFGPKTEAAVESFQKSKGLKVDGKVGPKTWAALGVK